MLKIKETFSNKYFNIILIGITLYFTVISITKLIGEFDFYSNYVLRISAVLLSILAFFTLLVKNTNGERFTRFFIIGVLIFPLFTVLNQFLVDSLFYGINRINLLQNTLLNSIGLVGILLYFLSHHFSKQTQTSHQKDFGLFICGIGIFIVMRTIIRIIEANYVHDMHPFSFSEITIKTVIIILLFFIGFRMQQQKLKFGKGLLFTFVLLFFNQIL